MGVFKRVIVMLILRVGFLFVVFLLVGCGGQSNHSAQQVHTQNQIIKQVHTQNQARDVQLQDRYLGMQWALFPPEERYTKVPFFVSKQAHINLGNMHRLYRGKGVKIAVIDDGLDVSHEDLQGAVLNTYDLATGSGNVAHNANELHGTATTGVIAARANKLGIFGVASESEIIFIKYKKSMSTDEMLTLFNKADELGADIISCSWGSGLDDKTGKQGVPDKVKAKIQELARTGRGGKGTVIVFASGNSNKDIQALNLEANIPEVIAVGASNGKNLRAQSSNYGNNLDVVAPGGGMGFSLGVVTLRPMGQEDGNTTLAKGTSIAAPIVSGVIALMLEKDPNLSLAEINRLLQTTSDKIGKKPYDANGHNKYYGYGKINVTKLLNAIEL